jgi:hypothetical protein
MVSLTLLLSDTKAKQTISLYIHLQHFVPYQIHTFIKSEASITSFYLNSNLSNSLQLSVWHMKASPVALHKHKNLVYLY